MLELCDHAAVEDREAPGHGLRLAGDLDAEEGARDDVGREAGHLVANAERLTATGRLAPSLEERLRALDHQPGEAGDPLAMEGRLHEPPLPQPVLAVRREQSLAEDRLEHPVVEVVLVVSGVMVLQHVLHVLGIRSR